MKDFCNSLEWLDPGNVYGGCGKFLRVCISAVQGCILENSKQGGCGKFLRVCISAVQSCILENSKRFDKGSTSWLDNSNTSKAATPVRNNNAISWCQSMMSSYWHFISGLQGRWLICITTHNTNWRCLGNQHRLHWRGRRQQRKLLVVLLNYLVILCSCCSPLWWTEWAIFQRTFKSASWVSAKFHQRLTSPNMLNVCDIARSVICHTLQCCNPCSMSKHLCAPELFIQVILVISHLPYAYWFESAIFEFALMEMKLFGGMQEPLLSEA